MRYPTVTISDAKRRLESLRQGAPGTVTVQWIGGADEVFDVDRVDDVSRQLQVLRRVMGEPSEGDRRYFAKFEGEASAIVHQALELPPYVAVDHEFWLWFTLGSDFDYPAKLVAWRHGGRAETPYDAKDSNFGLTTDLEQGFFSRVWLRGNIGWDPERADPYELSKRGDQDLWRSHLLRTEYGQVPNVAKALLRFQYGDDHPDVPRVKTKVIREMAKELRRRQATSAFELLDWDEAQQLVEDVHATVAPM